MTCQRCGNPMQPGDKFCGSCGAVALPPAPQAEKVVPEPPLRAQSTSYAPRRRNRLWINVAAISLLLLVSIGAVAALALNSGLELSGSSDPQPAGDPVGGAPTQREETQDPEVALVSPNAPPDPAFDKLLPTLRQRTNTEIMLPAELPDELRNVAVDADASGDSYGILFLAEPTGNVVEEYVHAYDAGTLSVSPEWEVKDSGGNFEATSVEKVDLPDGTRATLRYMEPVDEVVNYGPQWEGEFERYGNTYTLNIPSSDPSGKAARQVLSSMVLLPASEGEETNETTAPGAGDLEAEAEEAAGDYYWAADLEDWAFTYEHLDSETRSRFTREEWFEKNQWLADQGEATYYIESVELDETSQDPLAEVSVRITSEDGSSFVRDTFWVLENGEWLHRFGQEEYDSLMPGVPFEEWVEDEGGATPDGTEQYQNVPSPDELFPEDTNGDEGEGI